MTSNAYYAQTEVDAMVEKARLEEQAKCTVHLSNILERIKAEAREEGKAELKAAGWSEPGVMKFVAPDYVQAMCATARAKGLAEGRAENRATLSDVVLFEAAKEEGRLEGMKQVRDLANIALKEQEEELARLREALVHISKLGRVCPEFETCNHPWCEDSCGAALHAMNVLQGRACP